MLVDVRSPKEYEHAHIPGAYNIPLFTNEERHLVGLLYKQKGQDAAFELGLSFVGPKMASFVQQARQFDAVEVYCARGGMRSQSMHWLFKQAGIPTTIRPFGYKGYRKEVLQILKNPYQLKIITGFTGSGKTESLRSKPQYIDLEELANHRGSAFGFLGPQPSNEHLENLIASKLLTFNTNEVIWVEDESRVIGSCKVPDDFFHQMMKAPRIEIKCSFDERVKRLILTYGRYETSFIKKAILQIEKRLGYTRTKEALNLLNNNDLKSLVTLLLHYYDNAYDKSQKRYNKNNEYAL